MLPAVVHEGGVEVHQTTGKKHETEDSDLAKEPSNRQQQEKLEEADYERLNFQSKSKGTAHQLTGCSWHHSENAKMSQQIYLGGH